MVTVSTETLVIFSITVSHIVWCLATWLCVTNCIPKYNLRRTVYHHCKLRNNFLHGYEIKLQRPSVFHHSSVEYLHLNGVTYLHYLKTCLLLVFTAITLWYTRKKSLNLICYTSYPNHCHQATELNVYYYHICRSLSLSLCDTLVVK